MFLLRRKKGSVGGVSTVATQLSARSLCEHNFSGPIIPQSSCPPAGGNTVLRAVKRDDQRREAVLNCNYQHSGDRPHASHLCLADDGGAEGIGQRRTAAS